MQPIQFYSTNNKSHRVSFEDALLCGLAPDYGLYMVGKNEIPKLSEQTIREMQGKPYSEIAFEVLNPFFSSK